MPYTEVDRTEFKLNLIAKHAIDNPKMQFTSLAHLLNEEYLMQCFLSLNRNKAKGIDNVGWSDYYVNVAENISDLVLRLKSDDFKPLPARRVYIPKDDGKMRPLGISAIENKIVEKSIKGILESIYEQDFSGQSFGFRPKLSCHHALKEVHNQITEKKINHM
jgi:retron-type reverse transcriptase